MAHQIDAAIGAACGESDGAGAARSGETAVRRDRAIATPYVGIE
jgi:hypothetical protein